MDDSESRDFDLLVEIDKKVRYLEGKASEIKKQLDDALEEGTLRAKLVQMNAPELAANVPDRFKPRDSEPGAQLEVSTAAAPQQDRQPGTRPSGPPQAQVRQRDIVEWCRTILGGQDGEMHVSEIKHKLESTPNWRVPGQGRDSNVSVHLARSDEFERGSGRGMWRLTERSAS